MLFKKFSKQQERPTFLMSEKDFNIEPATVVIDIIAKHRTTEKVFKQYDIGSDCVLCQTLFDTVGDFARKCDLDLEQFMTELNTAIAEGRTPASS